jgi:hypothetical protein
MRFIENLCPPALLYLVYIVVQVGLDISLGLILTAGIKLVVGVAGTFILNAFCGVDLGIVSWAVIATPFIMTALAMSIALGLGIDRTATQMIKEKFGSYKGPLTTSSQGDPMSENRPFDGKSKVDPTQTLPSADGAPAPSNSIY